MSLELVTAGRALSEQGAGPVCVLLVAHDANSHAAAVDVPGVERILLADSSLDHFEAHVSERALAAAIDAQRPAVVLAGHTIDSLGVVPAVAARQGLGLAGDVTAIDITDGEIVAQRELYGGKLLAEVDFPGKQTVAILLRVGGYVRAEGTGKAVIESLQFEVQDGFRTEHVDFRDTAAGDVDIEKADFLLSIGRGVEEAENIPRFAELAERFGAILSSSRPLVDAGWLPGARQVGQSGRTVAPKVYLAMGISGAIQHLAGMSAARTIVAVNSDPAAPIFSVAHYGAVADMFDVADALEQQLK